MNLSDCPGCFTVFPWMPYCCLGQPRKRPATFGLGEQQQPIGDGGGGHLQDRTSLARRLDRQATGGALGRRRPSCFDDWCPPRYCRVLSAARNLRAFAELVETSLREMTFKDFCLARIMAPRECDAQLQTIGREVCASYRYEDYFRYDVVIGHAMNKTTPLFKSQVERCLAALPFAAPWVTRTSRPRPEYPPVTTATFPLRPHPAMTS